MTIFVEAVYFLVCQTISERNNKIIVLDFTD